jgi:hypothetical protein
MYACIPETGRGFFEGVCTLVDIPAQFCDPPPPSFERRFVLPSSQVSGQVFTRHTVAVTVEVIRIARVLLEHPLGLFVRFEAGAVEVAISPTFRTGRLRRCWRFSLRTCASPSYAVVPGKDR